MQNITQFILFKQFLQEIRVQQCPPELVSLREPPPVSVSGGGFSCAEHLQLSVVGDFIRLVKFRLSPSCVKGNDVTTLGEFFVIQSIVKWCEMYRNFIVIQYIKKETYYILYIYIYIYTCIYINMANICHKLKCY